MLTCAIRRSGVRGLDLFLTTGPHFGLLWLGGGKSGSVASSLGAGSWGVGSSRAAGSGAGIAAAGFNLRGVALADLIKQTQLYHHTSQKRAE
jgi:hypothetical protein